MDFKGQHIWIVYQSLEDEKVVIKEAICDWNYPQYADLRGQIAFHFLNDDKIKIIYNAKDEWYNYEWSCLYEDHLKYAMFLTRQLADDFYNHSVTLKNFILKVDRRTFHMNKDYYILRYDKNEGYKAVKSKIIRFYNGRFSTTEKSNLTANEIFTSKRTAQKEVKEMNKKELDKISDELGNMIIRFSIKRIEKPEIGKPYTIFNPYTLYKRDNVVFKCVSDDGKIIIDTDNNLATNNGSNIFGIGVYENHSNPMNCSQYTKYRNLLNKKRILEKALKLKS